MASESADAAGVGLASVRPGLVRWRCSTSRSESLTYLYASIADRCDRSHAGVLGACSRRAPEAGQDRTAPVTHSPDRHRAVVYLLEVLSMQSITTSSESGALFESQAFEKYREALEDFCHLHRGGLTRRSHECIGGL
jgi:hypothetical protein